MNKNDNHCYILSTSDKYELPIFVGDKMSDIASFLGAKSLNNLYKAIGRNNVKSGSKTYKLNRVNL